MFQLDGTNPHLKICNREGDTSNLCNYKCYERIYYRDQGQLFPYPKRRLSRILGPAKNPGNEITQKILIANGKVVPRCSIQSPTQVELFSPEEIRKRDVFTECIKAKLGDSIRLLSDCDPKHPDFIPYEDDKEIPRTIPENDVHSINCLLTDALINSKVLLNQGENLEKDIFKGNCFAIALCYDIDENRYVVGHHHEDPQFSTVLDEVNSLMVKQGYTQQTLWLIIYIGNVISLEDAINILRHY